MNLIFDEYEGVWIWVKTLDENYELSPRFDTEEDAQEWYNTVRKVFKGK